MYIYTNLFDVIGCYFAFQICQKTQSALVGAEPETHEVGSVSSASFSGNPHDKNLKLHYTKTDDSTQTRCAICVFLDKNIFSHSF